jgi:hypothetical protein
VSNAPKRPLSAIFLNDRNLPTSTASGLARTKCRASSIDTKDGIAFARTFAAVVGCYDDGFFGPHTGREAIAAMIGRWYVGGENFCGNFSSL